MDWQLLKNTVIFKNMTEQEIGSAFAALQAGEKSYRKGAAILHGIALSSDTQRPDSFLPKPTLSFQTKRCL